MGRRGRRNNYYSFNNYFTQGDDTITTPNSIYEENDLIIDDTDEMLIKLCRHFRNKYIYLKYIDPTFIRNTLENIIQNKEYYGTPKRYNNTTPQLIKEYKELATCALNIILDEMEKLNPTYPPLSISDFENITNIFASQGINLTNKYFIIKKDHL